MAKKIFICEDQVMFLDMLQDFLSPAYEIVSTQNSLDQLLPMLATHSPDLLLSDLYLPGPDAFLTFESVLKTHPLLQIVVMSGMLNDANLVRLHRLGIHGVVSKMGKIEDVVKAVETVLTGQIFYPDSFLKSLKTDEDPAFLKVSKREIEVMVLISQGMSEKQIAAELGISENTVNNHKGKIFSKLGVQNQVSMVVEGIRLGLIPNPSMLS